jgi:invasion protein IalB
VRISTRLAIAAALALASTTSGQAQQTPKAKGAPKAAQMAPQPASTSAPQADSPSANAPAPGWIARCSSTGRDTPLECAVEQSAVLTKTGQLLVLASIRVPGDTHAPIAFIQLPLGLNLPAGARLQVDDGKVVDLQVQTCEARGCYASTPIAPDLLAALKSGKQLKVSFQNLAKETMTIPMPLADFAVAYDRIK